MLESNLAIISFGMTAYELVSLNIPALYICISEDHFKSSEIFEKTGVGVTLGKFSKKNNYSLKNKIRDFLKDKTQIKLMSKNASRVIVSNLNKISKLILGKEI